MSWRVVEVIGKPSQEVREVSEYATLALAEKAFLDNLRVPTGYAVRALVNPDGEVLRRRRFNLNT